MDTVDHPPHYGGADSTYEAIKVIEAWELGFNLGNAVKYISRAGRKPMSAGGEISPMHMRQAAIQDLKKAAWYLNRRIEQLEREQEI